METTHRRKPLSGEVKFALCPPGLVFVGSGVFLFAVASWNTGLAMLGFGHAGVRCPPRLRRVAPRDQGLAFARARRARRRNLARTPGERRSTARAARDAG